MGLADFLGIPSGPDALQHMLCEWSAEHAYAIYSRWVDPNHKDHEPLIPVELPPPIKRKLFLNLASGLYLTSVALVRKLTGQKMGLEASRLNLFTRKVLELTGDCTKPLPVGLVVQQVGNLNEHEEARFAARVGDSTYLAYWKLRDLVRPGVAARQFFFGLHAEFFAQQVLTAGLDYHKNCVDRITLLQREALEFAQNLWQQTRDGTVSPSDLFAKLPGLDSSTLDRAG